MDLSLDTLKELFFDYNSNTLLDIFDELKDIAQNHGLMINSKSPDFVQIIIDNLIFMNDNYEEDDYILSD